MKDFEAKKLRDEILKDCKIAPEKIVLVKPLKSKFDKDFVLEIMLPNDKIVLINSLQEYKDWRPGILDVLKEYK